MVYARKSAEISSSLISPQTLLIIPTEIRLRIFRYALAEDYSYVIDFPNSIPVYKHRQLNPRTRKPWFYGIKAMSALLLISCQLREEVEEILYAQFVFAFTQYMNGESIRRFVEPLSPRARNLIREVTVGVTIYLGLNKSEEELDKDNKKAVQERKNWSEYLRDHLSGMKKFWILVGFIGGPLGGEMLPRKKDAYAAV